jgi:hypothetical protein
MVVQLQWVHIDYMR